MRKPRTGMRGSLAVVIGVVLAAWPVFGFSPVDSFRALTKHGDTLMQQVKTLETKASAAAKAPNQPPDGDRARGKVAWGAPCCGSNIQELRSTIGALRSTAKELQDHFRGQKQARWVTAFGEVQDAADSASAALDAFTTASDAPSALAAIGKLSEATNAVKSKIAPYSPCCSGK